MMPCDSSYLNATASEKYNQETAQLLVYLREKLSLEVSMELADAARQYYCNLDFTPQLCDLLRRMSPEEIDTIVYDGRSKDARRLADWWDEHQRVDEERQAQEVEKQYLADTALKAIEKLEPEELEAIEWHFKNRTVP
jgi:hypothetical protein